MLDRVSKEKRSKIMSAIRSKNTKPELTLRKALWAAGLRFRIHYGPEKIDIAFPSRKVAIFVDGCFWHGCPIHAHFPKSHQDYWVPKLNRNKERDMKKNERLKKAGWLVKRFWEHELSDLPMVEKEILSVLRKSPSRP
jgi:DNA mismatch endonuclease (patch repair protein)